MGELIISFLGPSPNDFLTRKALDVIGTYLTSSSVAPLNKEFVEIELPLWLATHHTLTTHINYFSSSYIYFGEDVRATRVTLPIYIGSVPTEHLDSFNEKLLASLRRIVKEGIDMERMSMLINRDERQVTFFCSAYRYF